MYRYVEPRESWLKRFWRSIQPPPAVERDRKRLRPAQKNIIRFTVSVLAGLALSGGGYYWYASAPDRAEAKFQEGMRLMSPGQYSQAIKAFTSAIGTRDGHAQAYLQRANAEAILGEQNEALADYERAGELDSRLAEAFTGSATILRDRGDTAKAAAALTKSIQVRPTLDGFLQRGQLFENLGDHQKAIEDYTSAIRLDPAAPYLYRARALARHNAGDEDGAEEDRKIANQIEHKPL